MNKPHFASSNKSVYPFVSICTPTFNRRPFVAAMIECFNHQTYPKDRMEWIIVDDGTDSIESLVAHIPQVKYFRYEIQMVLGKKRNLMHSKCSGDIIAYMDDDDYYPPERISHGVETLLANPEFLIAGSSEMHIYFSSKSALYQCGPYAKYHSTAATFIFKKELLLQTSYDETKALAEESSFLKQYTIPLCQLDVRKTILVFSHKQNTLCKEHMLLNPEACRTMLSKYTLDDFIPDNGLRRFYLTEMSRLLLKYKEGEPSFKPKALAQINEIKCRREKMQHEHRTQILMQNVDVQNLVAEYQTKLDQKDRLIRELMTRLKLSSI